MFTNFVNTYGTQQPRQAEHADGRLDIRRHEDEERRRKGEHEEEVEDLFANEDRASVSLGALIGFLEQFLKSEHVRTQKNDDGSEDTPPEAPKKHIAGAMNKQAKQPSSSQAKAAHNAYTHAARTQGGGNDFSERNAQETAKSLGISAQEVRTIHALLEDLKLLRDRGAEHLYIEKSTSFLQSLVDATLKAKAAFE